MLWGYFKGASADGIFLSTFIIPQGIEWFYILMIGISALFGQVYMTRAYGTTKAGIVATTGYFQIFFTAIVGIAIGDPFFQFYEWIGIALIIVGGIVISFEKHE
jgi:drug/metabolite transporter (DMT)-like permease